MLVRLEEELYVLDSQTDTGVALTGWKEFLFVNDLYQKVFYRRLHYNRKASIEQTILQFIRDSIGKKYQLVFEELIFKKKSSNNFYNKE